MKMFIAGIILALASTCAGAVDTFTPNINLVKPSIGSLNWGPKINSNSDLIDTAVAARCKITGCTFLGQIQISSHLVVTGNLTVGNLVVGGVDVLNQFNSIAVATTTFDMDLMAEISARGTGDYVLSVSTQYLQSQIDAIPPPVAGVCSEGAGGKSVVCVSGVFNSASGSSSTVSGGDQNTASGQLSTVIGGTGGTASAYAATVLGGYENIASGGYATTIGGTLNVASGQNAIAAGQYARATAAFATAWGWRSVAQHEGAFVLTGQPISIVDYTSDLPDQFKARFGGGFYFDAPGSTFTGTVAILGGSPGAGKVLTDVSGTGAATWETPSGGVCVLGAGTGSVLCSGVTNDASGQESVVGGGNTNTASGVRSTVGGGLQNTASAQWSTVGGGRENTANGQWGTVAGGDRNTAGFRDFIGGGFGNTTGGGSDVVAGGRSNQAMGGFATVAGGEENRALSPYSFIGGGYINTIGATAEYAAIINGRYNQANARGAVAMGDHSYANHYGATVFSDYTGATTLSEADNQFKIRYAGGAVLDVPTMVVAPLAPVAATFTILDNVAAPAVLLTANTAGVYGNTITVAPQAPVAATLTILDDAAAPAVLLTANTAGSAGNAVAIERTAGADAVEIANYAMPTSAYGMASDGVNTWVGGPTLKKVTPEGVISEFAPAVTPIVFDGVYMWAPSDADSTKMHRIDSAGTVVDFVRATASGCTAYGGAFDGANVWFTNSDKTISKTDISTGVETLFPDGAILPLGNTATYMAFDGTDMWVADPAGPGSPHAVIKFDLSGTPISTTPIGNHGNLAWLAFGGGYIWVVWSGGYVTRIPLDGLSEAHFDFRDFVNNQTYAVFDGTYLWVTAYGNNALLRVDMDGAATAYAIGANPQYAAIASGFLWTASSVNTLVHKITIAAGNSIRVTDGVTTNVYPLVGAAWTSEDIAGAITADPLVTASVITGGLTNTGTNQLDGSPYSLAGGMDNPLRIDRAGTYVDYDLGVEPWSSDGVVTALSGDPLVTASLITTGLTIETAALTGTLSGGLTPGTLDIATGAATINGTLKVVDGTQGAGKVFTSDADGLGSWQASGGGGGSDFPSGITTLDVRALVGDGAGVGIRANDSVTNLVTGGAVNIAAGDATVGDGPGGDINISGGRNKHWQTTPGGNINILAGGNYPGQTSYGGGVTIRGGSATTHAAGEVLITGGDGSPLLGSARGGRVVVKAGDASGSMNGGELRLSGGTTSAGGHVGGSIILDGGWAGDVAGSVRINTSGVERVVVDDTGQVGITGTLKVVDGTQGLGKVFTSDTDGLGSWQASGGGGGVCAAGSGDASVVCSGALNSATGSTSTVSGGESNIASGNHSFVGGGLNNKAEGATSVVSGGESNLASNTQTSIGGGFENKAEGIGATVLGGYHNSATGDYSTAGGWLSQAIGYNSVAIGQGISSASYAVTFGQNVNEQYGGTVSGGSGNLISASDWALPEVARVDRYGVIAGGRNNAVIAKFGVVGGGSTNINRGSYSSILGGFVNESSGSYSTVLGGRSNLAYKDDTIAAGRYAYAVNNGAAVFADGTGAGAVSTADNQLTMKYAGGAIFDVPAATFTGTVAATAFNAVASEYMVDGVVVIDSTRKFYGDGSNLSGIVSGIQDKVVKFGAGGTVLSTSAITDNGSTVYVQPVSSYFGINKTNPTRACDVNGSIFSNTGLTIQTGTSYGLSAGLVVDVEDDNSQAIATRGYAKFNTSNPIQIGGSAAQILDYVSYQGNGTFSIMQQYVAGNRTRFASSNPLAMPSGVLIGADGVLDASAALEVKSTTKGFLPPRMTAAQRSAISTPATGLVVYQTDDGTQGLYYWNGVDWQAVGGIVQVSSAPAGTFSVATVDYVGIATVTTPSLLGSRPGELTYTLNIRNGAGSSRDYSILVTENEVALDDAHVITNSGTSDTVITIPIPIGSTSSGVRTFCVNVKSSNASGTQSVLDAHLTFRQF